MIKRLNFWRCVWCRNETQLPNGTPVPYCCAWQMSWIKERSR